MENTNQQSDLNTVTEPVLPPNPNTITTSSMTPQVDPSQIIIGKTKLNRRLIGWLAIIVGVFFGLIALVLLVKDFSLLIHGEKTTGTVQSVSCHWDAAGVTKQTCDVQISFITKDGQQYPGTIQDAAPLDYSSGENISVSYNPGNPNEIVVANHLLFFRVIELIIIPAILLIGGIFLLRKPKMKIKPII